MSFPGNEARPTFIKQTHLSHWKRESKLTCWELRIIDSSSKVLATGNDNHLFSQSGEERTGKGQSFRGGET